MGLAVPGAIVSLHDFAFVCHAAKSSTYFGTLHALGAACRDSATIAHASFLAEWWP
jgi:hypothetical protein